MGSFRFFSFFFFFFLDGVLGRGVVCGLCEILSRVVDFWQRPRPGRECLTALEMVKNTSRWFL